MMRRVNAYVLTILLSAFLLPAVGAAKPLCFRDRGVRVCFPKGAISFADEAVSYTPGTPLPSANRRNPAKALGPPNYHSRQYTTSTTIPQNYISLGCHGAIVLRFTDNHLVDIPGPDLYVFEIGSAVEPSHLWISKDGKTWVDIGKIKGATAAVDIKRFVKPGDRFTYVKLKDLGSNCERLWGGADIDAVGAIGMVAANAPLKPAFGHLSVSATEQRIAGAAQVVLILDSSGSMRAKMRDGKRRIDVAKRVLVSVINKLPAAVRVGLRVYGHRYRSRPKRKSCRDSELLVPFGPLDRAAMKLAVSRLKPRGQTPIG